MRLQIFDQGKHEYVSKMYFAPMLAYARSNGIDLSVSDKLVPTKGVGMICDADHLTPAVIMHFKENDCPLFAFNCIDSAYLTEMLRFNPYLPLINRIFMISGVPNKQISHATVIDNDFTIRADPRHYLYDTAWKEFDFLRQKGAIQSLPYLIWNRVPIPERKSFEQRRPTILFRGGGHFLRVLAYMMALKNGCADNASGFLLSDYFKDDMNPQFRYCDDCRREFKFHGQFPYTPNPKRNEECNSIAEWGNELDLRNSGNWNNKCPRSFYWLAEQFQKKHGPIDMVAFERAMNFRAEPEEQHRQAVADVRFYADCKWEFSIYAAQRFWEAASVGTVNLLPQRAVDQDYFPVMKQGEHFVCFGDDMSGLDLPEGHFTAEHFNQISENAYQLWKKWIEPHEYAISTNLLKHIFDLIFTPRDC